MRRRRRAPTDHSAVRALDSDGFAEAPGLTRRDVARGPDAAADEIALGVHQLQLDERAGNRLVPLVGRRSQDGG
jgi:hypothetical protein